MPLYTRLSRNGEAVDPDPSNSGWSRTDMHMCYAWAAQEQGLELSSKDWKLSDIKLPHTYTTEHQYDYPEDPRVTGKGGQPVKLQTCHVLPGDVFEAWR